MGYQLKPYPTYLRSSTASRQKTNFASPDMDLGCIM